MAISPEDFVKRLDSISEHEGVAYGRVHLLFDEEEKYGQAILQYKGYLALSDAFKCFFLETVELLNTECRPKVKTPLSEFYPLFVPRLAHSFQCLCGAERVAIRGYPYHGYTLLRNLFDNLVLTSAAFQKITDFYSVEGINPAKPFDPNAFRKLRKVTEFAVRKKMTGDQSGLTKQTLDKLVQWDALFDYETHGARLRNLNALFLDGTIRLALLAVNRGSSRSRIRKSSSYYIAPKRPFTGHFCIARGVRAKEGYWLPERNRMGGGVGLGSGRCEEIG